MGKFGKKVSVSTNLNDYMIGVMAPSGFGKTTLMYQVCEKEFGPDGYIVLDMGTEDGTSAIEGITAEPVPTWKKMKEVVDDIVKNKETDYKELKVVVLDTLDAAFEAAEAFTVAAWNKENMGKQGFVNSTSINSVEGGFGKGMDRVIETVKKEITRLEKVGVKTYWTSHVKEKDQSDLFTGANYTSLTANMPMKYFNSIKNSSHVVAFGYFDRSIEKQEVGDANPMTKKKKERKSVVDEVRKVKFRDDALVADAKSRFKHITDEIILDADKFIEAIKDAISAEKGSAKVESVQASAKKKIVVEEPIEEEDFELEAQVEAEDVDLFDADEELAETELITLSKERLTAIRTAFRTADEDAKNGVKAILDKYDGRKLAQEMYKNDVETIEEILGIE